MKRAQPTIRVLERRLVCDLVVQLIKVALVKRELDALRRADRAPCKQAGGAR